MEACSPTAGIHLHWDVLGIAMARRIALISYQGRACCSWDSCLCRSGQWRWWVWPASYWSGMDTLRGHQGLAKMAEVLLWRVAAAKLAGGQYHANRAGRARRAVGCSWWYGRSVNNLLWILCAWGVAANLGGRRSAARVAVQIQHPGEDPRTAHNGGRYVGRGRGGNL